MTIRLSAMFEEHMRRIMYNWKSARRRETFKSRRNRRVSSLRKNGQRNTRQRPSDDDDDDDDVTVTSSSPTRKNTTPRKVNIMTNGHPSTSRSAVNTTPRSTSITPRTPARTLRNRNRTDSENEGSELDSEESYRPNSRGNYKHSSPLITATSNHIILMTYSFTGKRIVKRNKGKRRRRKKKKKIYCGESDLSDISKRTRAKTNIIQQSESDSDSDNEPLVNCVNNRNATSNVNNEDSKSSDSSEESSSEEEVLPQISSRLRSSHDETSQSSSRPTRQTKRPSYRNSWQENVNESSEEVSEEEESEEEATPQLRSSVEHPSSTRSRQKRNQTSSESENSHLPQRSARAKRFNYRKMLEFSDESGEENNTRTRRGKRPHYNEDSDSETNGRRRNKRRNVNESDNETPNVISISSRGRIRKLTARAKAFLRD